MIEYIEENGEVILDLRGNQKIHYIPSSNSKFLILWLINFLRNSVPGTFQCVDTNNKSEGEYRLVVQFYDQSVYLLTLLNMELVQEAIMDKNLNFLYLNDPDESINGSLLSRVELGIQLKKSYIELDESIYSFVLREMVKEIVEDSKFLRYLEEKWKNIGFNMTLDRLGRVIEYGNVKYPLPLDVHGTGLIKSLYIIYHLYKCSKSSTPCIIFSPYFFTGFDSVRRRGLEKIVEEDLNGKLITL